ncbi:MAG: Beta-xylosidase [Lachnoclostridium sp.]|jgi:xylan 1,4-beta-xylosidase
MKKLHLSNAGQPFRNFATYCVGTGRMGLALQKEYQEHLKLVQDKIKFSYIRGHGLFCDDVGIYQEIEKDGKIYRYYNFTYLDRIFDYYLELNIRPYLELGFMPKAMASGDSTIFYWKGNVTPPKDYEEWANLVKATLTHLIERYGRDEVITWPIEVWNEPNIGFWAGSMEEYFKLYEYSARVIKEVDPDFKVGGPAICGVDTENWLHSFFQFCQDKNVPIDMVTRHCYMAKQPKVVGRYVYQEMVDATDMINELKLTRNIMNQYDCVKDKELHITEFNSSYDPVCPVHDMPYNAAFIARVLSEAGDYAEDYSYWTFSDVFEEKGIPASVFHGGFGLVANYSIPKPTFYTFEFFSRAGKELIYRDENMIVTKDENDRYCIIGWSYHDPRDGKTLDTISYEITMPAKVTQYFGITKDVGGKHCNPAQTWSNLGKPRTLNKEQVKILQEAATPFRTDEKVFAKDGKITVNINIECNHLVMMELLPVKDETESYWEFNETEFYGLQ